MTTATLPFRIKHQFLTEWRHHRAWILAWIAWVILRRFWRVYEGRGDYKAFSALFGSDLVPVITLLLAAAVAWRCVRGDPPSNADCATLTRPIGQAALWLGKLVFLACGVVLPLLVVESTSWAGYQHGWAQWLALGGGLLAGVGLVLGLAGAVTALGSSTRQVVAFAVSGLFAAALWLGLGASAADAVLSWSQPEPDTGLEAVRVCGGIVAAGIALPALMAAWWCATVPRRRGRAAVLLLAGLAQVPLVAAWWPLDWITPPALHYPAGKLGVKTGKADPVDKIPSRALWPTLRLTGLSRNEVASIIAFAPVPADGEEWPPLGSHTDLPVDNVYDDSWLHLGHARSLMPHSPPATLWRDSLRNSLTYSDRRPKLREAIKPLRLDPNAPPARWRLRLAVHEMRRIDGPMPFKQFWTRKNVFPVRPGLRVEFQIPKPYSDGGWGMAGRLHQVRSLLLPERAHAPARAAGRPLTDAFLLVLEDPELRENTAEEINSRRGYGITSPYYTLQVDKTQSFEVSLQTPKVQHHLLGTTHEDWMNRLNVSLWHAEERGVVDLELSAEEMARALEAP